MSYSHLTSQERQLIYQWRVLEKLPFHIIASRLGRSQSSISREVQRNSHPQLGYLPDTAHTTARQRRQLAKSPFLSFSEEQVQLIKDCLKKYHSPEQIAGRLKKQGLDSVSHESIYQMIYANHMGLHEYHFYLRRQHIKRKKRKPSDPDKLSIPGRVGIEHRPKIADEKTEIGHWESDTMIGGRHHGVIVTHVDKASKFLLAGLAKKKTSSAINMMTLELFENIPSIARKTITSDNGKEFCGHQLLSKELDVEWYFAHPYSSYERGLNEHTNGLIRQFFPKGTNFRITKQEELEKVVDLINNRPRKSLDYRTPAEVFYEYISDDVALHP
jgi:IS30 family transposase